MTKIIKEKPLFSLTIGEFLEIQREFQEIHSKVENPKEVKELLSIHEASEYLQLSVPTLYTLNCKGRIPFTKVSGKVYYRRTALEQWLESGERKTKAQLRREIEEG